MGTATTADMVRFDNSCASLQDAMTIGRIFAESGMFPDMEAVAQCVTKILCGAELGVKPFQSMNGLHIIKGKTTVSAGLMATLVKRSGRYNYRVLEHTDTSCRIAFFEHGEPCGESSFNMDDARKANLLGNPMWQKYTKNMLFARCLSNGVRWYAADVFGGPVYTPEELGANVDAEGEVIDLPANPAPAQRTAPQQPATTSQAAPQAAQATQETTEATTTTTEAKKQTPAQIATAAAKQTFIATAAEFGIVYADLARENATAWFETLYGGKPAKYDAETWTKLAHGMKALQIIAPGIAPETILQYVQSVWPEMGSLLQMGDMHWQGVVGMIEDEQAEANHLKESAAPEAPEAPLTLTGAEDNSPIVDAAKQTMGAIVG